MSLNRHPTIQIIVNDIPPGCSLDFDCKMNILHKEVILNEIVYSICIK